MQQKTAAKAASKAAQEYADALVAKASSLAEAAAAANLAAQNAVQVAEHTKAAQQASVLATKSMLSPSHHLHDLSEGSPLATAIAGKGRQQSSVRNNGCTSSSAAESCSTEPLVNLTEFEISGNPQGCLVHSM